MRIFKYFLMYLALSTVCGCERENKANKAVEIPPEAPDESNRQVPPALVESDPPMVEIDFAARLSSLEQSIARIEECSDSIWPGFRLSDFNIVVNDSGKKKAWQLMRYEEESAKFDEIDFESLKPEWVDSGFYIDRKGEPLTLVLSLNYAHSMSKLYDHHKRSDYLVELAVHEAFHFTTQRSWSGISSLDRADDYPASPEPRIIRYMITKNLESYLKNGNQDELQQASYWYGNYQRQFPSEANRSRPIDKLEGTARYAEMKAGALLKYGCELRSEEIVSYAISPFGMRAREKAGAVRESYHIGGMASLALDKLGKQWKPEMEAGIQSPLDLLLEGVPAKTEDVPTGIKERLTQSMERRNWTIERRTKVWREAKISPDYTPIVITGDLGTYSFEHIVRLNDIGGTRFYTDLAVTKTFGSAEKYLQLYRAQADTLDGNNPCSRSGVRIFVEKSAFKGDIQSQELTIMTDGITTRQAPVRQEVATDGRVWLCIDL